MESDILVTRLQEALRSVDFEKARKVLSGSDFSKILSAGNASLRLRCLAAEVFDYFDDAENASRAIGFLGKQCHSNLQELTKDNSKIGTDDRESFKCETLVTLYYGYLFYRQHNYHVALQIWEACREFVTEHLMSPKDYPCHGTLGRIYYAIGLAHRQEYRYGEAKRYFAQAVDEALRDMGEARATGRWDSELSEYRIGKCLALGLSWVFYTEGVLHLTKPLLEAAHQLLANKPEKIIRAYVAIVQACVQMAEKGDQEAELRKALATLKMSYDLFSAEKHVRYSIRAAQELSLAYLRLGLAVPACKREHLKEAWEYARKALNNSKAAKNGRWQANACIAISRLHRAEGNFKASLRAAGNAMKHAKGDNFTTIDALIAQGEASYEMGEFEPAMRDFRAALELSDRNPKVVGVCNLHLTRCCLMKKDLPGASHYFGRWREISRNVDHFFPHQLAKQIQPKLEKHEGDLILFLDSPDITRDKVIKAGQAFLYRWLMEHKEPGQSIEDAAKKRLSISKGTIINYKKKNSQL